MKYCLMLRIVILETGDNRLNRAWGLQEDVESTLGKLRSLIVQVLMMHRS